jgi:iron complex outermembrane recepter protein
MNRYALRKLKENLTYTRKYLLAKHLHFINTPVRMAHKILILSLLFLPFTVLSQGNITVKVTGQTNTAISFATLTLYKDTTLINTVVTGNDGMGRFENLNAGKYKLGISYLKLQEQPILFEFSGKDTVFTHPLSEKGITLSEITVQSRKPVIERQGDRIVFTPAKILTEGSNAIDIMRMVPFVRFNDVQNILSIIGKSSTVVYINNRKTDMPKEMIIEMLRSLPAENIKNIEVITNPGSEYTAATTGGIININIRRMLNEGWQGNLAAQSIQGVFNMNLVNGFVNYYKGKVGIQFLPNSGSYFNYNTIVNTLGYPNDALQIFRSEFYRRYSVLGGGLNIDYTVNKNSFLSYNGWFSGVNGRSRTDVITDYTKINQPAIDSVYSSPNTGRDRYRYNFGNINYHYTLNNKTKAALDFNVDYNDFYQRRENIGHFRKVNQDGNIIKDFGSYKNILPQSFFNLSARIEYTQQIGKKSRFSTGAQYSDTKVSNDLKYYSLLGGKEILDNSISNDYYYTERYWAGFTSFSHKINSKLSGSIGLRFEQTDYSTQRRNLGIRNDSLYSNLFPSLSLSYSPSAKHQVGFSTSRKIIRPSWEALFPGRVYINERYFRENNPFLQPALYYSTEMSYTYNNSHSLIVGYSNVKNSSDNFIIPIVENGVSKLKSTRLNYGSAQTISAMLNLNYTNLFNGKYELNIVPSFAYSEYKAEIPDIPQRIDNRNFNLMIDQTFYISTKKKWTAFVTWNYYGTRRDMAGQLLTATSNLQIVIKKVVKKFTFYLIADDFYNGTSRVDYLLTPNPLLSSNRSEMNRFNQVASFKIRYKFGNTQLKTTKNRGNANDDMRRRSGG